MVQRFSSETEEGLRLVWRQFDPAEILRGRNVLERAARNGDPEAFCLLARTYMGKDYLWEYAGLKPDENKAAEILKESIAAGSACGVLTAVRCGELTPSARRDMPFSSLEEAWDTLQGQAEAGNAFCQYLVGEAYYYGDYPFSGEEKRDKDLGMPKQSGGDSQAALWLERALAAGISYAGHCLDRMYRNRGDEAARRRVAERCASLGAPVWEERMACYLYEEDPGKGIALFLQAAEHGQITSFNTVGCACLTGTGVPVDPERAFQCLEKGARGGDPNAQRNLAWMYFEGQAVPRDDARAAYWISCAAGAPHGQAEYSYPLLAHCTLHGIGAPQNIQWGLNLLTDALEFNLSSPENEFRYDERSIKLLYRDMGDFSEKGLLGRASVSRAANAYETAARYGDAESARRLTRFQKGMFGKWKRR